MFAKFCTTFFGGRLWRYLTGSLGALVGLFLLGKHFLYLTPLHSFLLGLGVLLVLFISAFIVYCIRVKWFSKNSYGEAIIRLKNGFANINSIKRENTSTSEEISFTLSEMCNNLKLVFDTLTKVDCSISIKVPTLNEPISSNAIVENISRDYGHYLTRNTEEYKKQVHYVMGNTAYQEILTNVLNGDRKKFYYINNNVPKSKNYHTTSRPAYPNGVLPYKSELVYPILPMKQPKVKQSESARENYDIWGFLCVDCNFINKFNDNYHVAIIEGVADGIFDVIMKTKQNNH